MPNRVLREGIITSERVNKLSWPAEVFYRRLMSIVDDFGRYYAKPELLRAGLYPLCLDKVGNPDIAKWIRETEEAGLVRTYTFENKEFLEIVDFRQHQRAKASKFPAPDGVCDADAVHMQRKQTAHTHEGEGGDEGEGVRRKTTIPTDFSLTDDLIAYASKQGIQDLKTLDGFTDRFVNQCKAKGYRYVDFKSTWKNWLRRDIEEGKLKEVKYQDSDI